MTPPSVQLRHADAADIDAIVALERATANAPHWPPATYAAIVEAQSATDAETSGPQRCLFVAEIANQIAGFAVGLMHRTEPIAELETVAVATSARRAGVGRALCVAVLDWCREQGAASIVLEVRATSGAAIALYTGLGFTPTGRRPHYYRDPDDDALILNLNL